MAQQTAVEWLFNKLLLMNPNLLRYGGYLEQAKAMHKTDTEKVWVAGVEYAISVLKDKISKESKEAFEQYYNETYNK